VTAQNRGLTGEQISMLEMLAGCPDGCSEAVLKANGFTIGSLGKLIRAGLATATPGIVEAGGRTLGVVRLAITEKGRTMIAR
jgi:phage tail protein X